MGAEEAVMDGQVGEKDDREEGGGGAKEEQLEKEGKREAGEEVVVEVEPPQPARISRLQTQAPVAPIQVAPHSPSTLTRSVSPPFHQPQLTPMQSVSTLNSRGYTNRISLFLFLLHLAAVSAAISFFVYKAVEGLLDGSKRRKEKHLLSFWLPQVEGSALLSIVLAFAWQKAVRLWPAFLIRFILWTCFATSMAAGVLLLSFSIPTADPLAVALIAFSIGNGLYACWVIRRIPFAERVFIKSLHPATKFRDLNRPTYLMLGISFLWISVWCFAVIGALNFYYPPLTIIVLVLSLAWTAEVMRNVTNLTVSRVVALYYLRGMQSNTEFCFQRAVTRNLGSACLGSLFLPTIEACRIIARGLNLLEGEDEFMFSCAHCCLRVMETIFRNGNSWAFVHIAAYGKGFAAASRSTWGLFERLEMDRVVDGDITSSICFLTGVTSGSLCVIFASSWTFAAHKPYTATVSLLAFLVGYLMTRVGMALPQACVACYYVCYAENPGNRLFDSTIPDRLNKLRADADMVAPTPRFPRRSTAI